MSDKATLLQQVCQALTTDQVAAAQETIRDHYPFVGAAKQSRRYSKLQMLRVFRRDGFIDRYAGARLVFPGALRIISLRLPDAFPFHPNWKMSATHPAYWELLPTIDHVVPVARGGADDESNWVTTSQLRNSAKANWTLEELGWTLHPQGKLAEWDGMCSWFCHMLENNAELRNDPYLKAWHRAAQLNEHR